MDSDKQIVKKVLEGEASLFEGLVTKYLPRLMGFFYKMGLNRQDAEDLAQDTLVKVYQNLWRYDGSWEFSTWLYKIASNTCRDFLKKPRPMILELDEDLNADHRSEDALDRMLTHHDIKALLQVLKPDARIILLLHYYNGLTLEEIGKLFRLSTGAVKMKLCRAREKLLKEAPEKAVII